LPTNFHRKTIIDFRMPGNRSFGAIQRIDENRVSATFAFKPTTVALQVSH
jgi:hypothetical protein